MNKRKSNTIVCSVASLVTTCCLYSVSANAQTNAQVVTPPPVLSETAPAAPEPAAPAPVAPPVVAPSVTGGAVGSEVVVSAQPQFMKGLSGKAYSLDLYSRGREFDVKNLNAELANPDNAPIVFTDDNPAAFTTLSKKSNPAGIFYNTIVWEGFLNVKRAGSYTFIFRAGPTYHPGFVSLTKPDVLQLSVGGRYATVWGQEGRMVVELKNGMCPFRIIHVGSADGAGRLKSFADAEIFYFLNGAPGQPRKLTPGGGYLFHELKPEAVGW